MPRLPHAKKIHMPHFLKQIENCIKIEQFYAHLIPYKKYNFSINILY